MAVCCNRSVLTRFLGPEATLVVKSYNLCGGVMFLKNVNYSFGTMAYVFATCER